MKILVDENIPRQIVRSLCALGHEVIDVRGTPDQALPDDALWRRAQQERALLVTTDKGFARHRDEPHCGIPVIRLRRPNRTRIHDRVLEALRRFGEHEWAGLLVVMRDQVQSVRRERSREP